MATAKAAGGLYYIGETAVDAHGVAIEGAPARSKDTDPRKQPGAVGGQSESDKMAQAIATGIAAALANMGVGGAASAAGAPDESEEITEFPTLAALPEHLAALSTVAEVEQMRDADERKGAQKHYEARIAELSGE